MYQERKNMKYDFEKMKTSLITKEMLEELLKDSSGTHPFFWDETPQGRIFWSNVYADGHTKESREAINEMIAQLESENDVICTKENTNVGDYVMPLVEGGEYSKGPYDVIRFEPNWVIIEDDHGGWTPSMTQSA